MGWLIAVGLCVLPLPVGLCVGLVIDSWLCLREIKRGAVLRPNGERPC